MAPTTDATKRRRITMAKSVEFIASGSSSALGNFSSGSIARNIPDALADHLVKDAMCAKYLPDVSVQPAAEVAPPAPAVKRSRKPAANTATEQKED
jgi:hypothetical protein